MLEASFANGESVVYRAHGIGQILGTEQKGSNGQELMCFVVKLTSGMRAYIPVDNAATTLRRLCSRSEAESGLEALRAGAVEPDARRHREKIEGRERTMRLGTRADLTQLLRQLYAAKAPVSGADGLAIRTLEDIVLEEISLVLGIPRAGLEIEMRERYPVFSEKKRARG